MTIGEQKAEAGGGNAGTPGEPKGDNASLARRTNGELAALTNGELEGRRVQERAS